MDYKKPYIHAVLRCVIPAALTAVINIVCLVLRTDANHNWMLMINLMTNWICGVFLVYFTSCHVQPKKELYRLSRRHREEIQGIIDRIDQQSVRYERLTCVAVFVGHRQLFAPVGLSLPKTGENATFSVAGNVILEVAE